MHGHLFSTSLVISFSFGVCVAKLSDAVAIETKQDGRYCLG